MDYKFSVGDRVKPAGRPGPEMTITSQIAATSLFERYFAAPRYLCHWEGCDLLDGGRVFAEFELIAASAYPGAGTSSEPVSLFI